MATWADIEREHPGLAEGVRRAFGRGVHKTIATLRADGSPRISGIEVEIQGGEVRLGMMAGSLKLRDVRRDPRVAIHGPTPDQPGETDRRPGTPRSPASSSRRTRRRRARSRVPATSGWTCARWCSPGWASRPTTSSWSPGTRAGGTAAVRAGERPALAQAARSISEVSRARSRAIARRTVPVTSGTASPAPGASPIVRRVTSV